MFSMLGTFGEFEREMFLPRVYAGLAVPENRKIKAARRELANERAQ